MVHIDFPQFSAPLLPYTRNKPSNPNSFAKFSQTKNGKLKKQKFSLRAWHLEDFGRCQELWRDFSKKAKQKEREDKCLCDFRGGCVCIHPHLLLFLLKKKREREMESKRKCPPPCPEKKEEEVPLFWHLFSNSSPSSSSFRERSSRIYSFNVNRKRTRQLLYTIWLISNIQFQS